MFSDDLNRYAVACKKLSELRIHLYAYNTELSETRSSLRINNAKIEKMQAKMALVGAKSKFLKSLALARTKVDLLKNYEAKLLEGRAELKQDTIWCLTQLTDFNTALAVVDYLYKEDDPLYKGDDARKRVADWYRWTPNAQERKKKTED